MTPPLPLPLMLPLPLLLILILLVPPGERVTTTITSCTQTVHSARHLLSMAAAALSAACLTLCFATTADDIYQIWRSWRTKINAG